MPRYKKWCNILYTAYARIFIYIYIDIYNYRYNCIYIYISLYIYIYISNSSAEIGTMPLQHRGSWLLAICKDWLRQMAPSDKCDEDWSFLDISCICLVCFSERRSWATGESIGESTEFRMLTSQRFHKWGFPQRLRFYFRVRWCKTRRNTMFSISFFGDIQISSKLWRMGSRNHLITNHKW